MGRVSRLAVKVAGATVAFSAMAYAMHAAGQELTAEEKYQQLLEAGIFDTGGGLPAQDMSREQLAVIVSRLLDLETSSAASTASTFQDVSESWHAGYIQAVNQPGLFSGAFDPSAQFTVEQLASIFGKGMLGQTGPNLPVEGTSTWAQAYVDAAIAAGLVPPEPTQSNRAQLVESFYNALPDDGAPEEYDWSDFPFYAADQRTTVMPDYHSIEGGHATYSGIVRGSDGNGTALSGTSEFDVGFHFGGAEIDGAFNFDTGDTVNIVGLDSGGTLGMWVEPGSFQGGVISDSDVNAAFYGPNAEEFGGEWSLTVEDGTAPGTAFGEFATKR